MIADRRAAHSDQEKARSAQEKTGSVVPHEREPARKPVRRAAKDFEATALVQAAGRRELRGRLWSETWTWRGFAACDRNGFGRYTARTGS